ncbi:hypothetical protein, partial [Vibrio anguillarum]|uniref:hypothetical protein n=1 Tax=Vibrio anguillarum TaxID=55601 RepID=UPI001BE411A1
MFKAVLTENIGNTPMLNINGATKIINNGINLSYPEPSHRFKIAFELNKSIDIGTIDTNVIIFENVYVISFILSISPL